LPSNIVLNKISSFDAIGCEKEKYQRNISNKNIDIYRQLDRFYLLNKISVPSFDFVVIESLLHHVYLCEYQMAKEMLLTAEYVINRIVTGPTVCGEMRGEKSKINSFSQVQAKLGDLLSLKIRVDVYEAKFSEISAVFMNFLENNVDIAAIKHLKNKCNVNDKCKFDNVPSVSWRKNFVNLEFLFEEYLLQFNKILYSVRSVKHSIENLQKVVVVELDMIRSRIIHYEMLFELAGLVLGIAAAVTGMFGMNLMNHFEEHYSMFYQVSIGLTFFLILIGYNIFKILEIEKIV